ncbi:TPA: hypothetical protein ACXNP2_000076 [Stenotrophomonas maltophilia]
MKRILALSVAAVVLGGAAWYGFGKHDSSTAVAAVEGAAEQSDEHSLARGAPTTPTNAVESTPWARADSHLAGSWFADLRSRAEAGDVFAQRQLAEAYQRCAVFSLSPANMYATLDAYAEVRGVPARAYDDIKKRFAANCSGVDGGQVIPVEAYGNWFERAAAKGDPYSRVAIAFRNRAAFSSEDYQSLARDVVSSADPEAMFALGDLLTLAQETNELAEFKASMASPYSTFAWGIVACRMGADCSHGSYRMDSLCMNTGICGTGDFEEAIRTHAVPVGQQEALDKAIAEVQRTVSKQAN